MEQILQPKADSQREERDSHHPLKGIQPVARSSYLPFQLPSHGDAENTCGVWMYRGCLHFKDHIHASLDGVSGAGKDVIQTFRASCGRIRCPVCYEKACFKQALKIENRMMQFHIQGRELKAIHVVVSPSKRDVEVLEFKKLKRKAITTAKGCGVYGGSIIFHHLRAYREDDNREKIDDPTSPHGWYFSPHFHIIGFGWVSRVKENYEKSGWIVKNLGVRRSIRATAHYQLSHCAVHKKHHTVVWFGALSYNKLKVRPLKEKNDPCPLCSREMQRVCLENIGLEGNYLSIVESSFEDGQIWMVDHGLFYYADQKYRQEVGDG